MNRKIFMISLFIFAIDQVSKVIIDSSIALGETISVIKNFFYLTYYQNYGAAWSILQNKTIFIIIGTILALILIYRYMYSFKMNKRNIAAFGLLTGGIVGNLVDRILNGYVIDFFQVEPFGYNFPIFNVADMAIVIGVFLLVLAIIRGEDKIEKVSSRKK